MKHKVENSEIEIDARGLECPIPVLKARKLSQTLNKPSNTRRNNRTEFHFFQ